MSHTVELLNRTKQASWPAAPDLSTSPIAGGDGPGNGLTIPSGVGGALDAGKEMLSNVGAKAQEMGGAALGWAQKNPMMAAGGLTGAALLGALMMQRKKKRPVRKLAAGAGAWAAGVRAAAPKLRALPSAANAAMKSVGQGAMKAIKSPYAKGIGAAAAGGGVVAAGLNPDVQKATGAFATNVRNAGNAIIGKGPEATAADSAANLATKGVDAAKGYFSGITENPGEWMKNNPMGTLAGGVGALGILAWLLSRGQDD